MRPRINLLAGFLAAAFAASCVDSQAFLPAIVRMKEPNKRAPDPMPDTVEFVRTNLALIFLESSRAHDISVSEPRPNGFGWKACLRASFSDVTGKPAGPFTFVLLVDNGKVGDRRRAEPSDDCDNATFTAIQPISPHA